MCHVAENCDKSKDGANAALEETDRCAVETKSVLRGTITDVSILE